MPEKKKVTKDVNVTRIVEPRYMTLVKKGSNQVAFKVVRGEEGGAPKIVRQRPTRRMSPTLAIQFPDTYTEDEAHALMKQYGFSDYKLEKKDGQMVALRADAVMPKQYGTIALKDGVKALVTQGQAVASDEDPKPNLAVVEINFNKAQFDTPEAVREWLTRNSVDFSGDVVFNPDNKAVVVRHKVEDGTEVKVIEPEEGVEIKVAKAADQDVPENLILVVNETMYGSWGWGQLDFAATMADIEYSEAVRFATDTLYRVLENLLYWSPLPVTARKELVARATKQYSDFVGALLDQLPAKVVLNERSDNKGETDMTQKTEVQKRAEQARAYLKEKGMSDDALKALKDEDAIKQADTKRSEEDAAAKAAADAAAKPITRGEVEEMLKANNESLKNELLPQVGSAVRDSLKDIFAPTTQRGDAANLTPEQKAAAEAKAKESADLGKSIGEAMRAALEPVVKQVEEQGKALKTVAETVEKVAGQTTVRSDGGDGKTTDKPKDVFKGMFQRGAKPEQQATQ